MARPSLPANAPLARLTCAPAPLLASAIARLWGVERLVVPQLAMPDGGVDVIVTLAPELGAYVVGAQQRATAIDRLPGHTLVGFTLHPGVAAAVFGCDAHELAGKLTTLDQVIGRSAHDLIERVQRAQGFPERARALQRFVHDRLVAAAPDVRPQPLVQTAVDAIRASEGRVSIATLAREQHCTPRVLQRAFQRHVGLSPKRLARIVRFHAALRALQRGQRMVEIAFAQGYADQAHFVRDFGELAGRSPSAFIHPSAIAQPANDTIYLVD